MHDEAIEMVHGVRRKGKIVAEKSTGIQRPYNRSKATNEDDIGGSSGKARHGEHI